MYLGLVTWKESAACDLSLQLETNLCQLTERACCQTYWSAVLHYKMFGEKFFCNTQAVCKVLFYCLRLWSLFELSTFGRQHHSSTFLPFLWLVLFCAWAVKYICRSVWRSCGSMRSVNAVENGQGTVVQLRHKFLQKELWWLRAQWCCNEMRQLITTRRLSHDKLLTAHFYQQYTVL